MRFSVRLTIWLLLLMLALMLDAPVARVMRENGWEAWLEHNSDLREFLKWPGEYWLVLLLALTVTVLHRLHWRAGLFVLTATAISGVNGLIKWVVGRHRPYTWLGEQIDQLRPLDLMPFRGGWAGILDGKNLSVPSGHSAVAFALATALAMLWPRVGWVFFLPAIAVGVERVWENAHWTSDVVAAAGLGWAGVHFVAWMADRLGLADLRDSRMIQSPERTQPPSAPARLPVMVEVQPPSSGPAPYLSLVIPAYNEQENIPTLLTRVGATLAQINRPFEVVIVDDGSKDDTPRLLADATGQYPWLRVVRMTRNSGQSAAFEAGFEAARGEVIATIDADLQNDPEEIPRLLPLLDEKRVDMITGWRKDRQDTPFRRWQSRQANRIRNWISQETVNDSASSLKLYRAHAIKGLKLFNGAHRFFPTLVKMRGYTCYETPVKHSPRFAGTAKYGFRNRAVRAFVDLLAIRWMKTRWLDYQAKEVNGRSER